MDRSRVVSNATERASHTPAASLSRDQGEILPALVAGPCTSRNLQVCAGSDAVRISGTPALRSTQKAVTREVRRPNREIDESTSRLLKQGFHSSLLSSRESTNVRIPTLLYNLNVLDTLSSSPPLPSTAHRRFPRPYTNATSYPNRRPSRHLTMSLPTRPRGIRSETGSSADTTSTTTRIAPLPAENSVSTEISRIPTRGLFNLLSNTQPRVTFTPGGYPDEIFMELKPEDLKEFECCICYQVLCEPRQCENNHSFCSACIELWAAQSSSACRDKCPVCRAPATGYRSTAKEAWSRLMFEKVKCLEERCCWNGVLRDYRRHMRNRHQTYFYSNQGRPTFPQSQLSSTLPNMSSSYGAGQTATSVANQQPGTRAINQGWHRLESMMDAFTEQLERRRLSVENAYREQERARQEQMKEAQCIGRQLGKVASDLTTLIDNISRDTMRYRSYITSSVDQPITRRANENEASQTNNSNVAPPLETNEL